MFTRVHLGTYVAELKFQKDPKEYTRLAKAGDRKGLEKELTVPKQEKKVLARVREKGKRFHIDPKFRADFYEKKVIPLTVEVEVEYCIRRVCDMQDQRSQRKDI